MTKKETAHWIDDYLNAMMARASEFFYQELKKVESGNSSYSNATWCTMQKIRANNLCFNSDDIEMVRRALTQIDRYTNEGKYKTANGTKRGLLDFESTAMLDEFDHFFQIICSKIKERHLELYPENDGWAQS